jgi:hypothetical protein
LSHGHFHPLTPNDNYFYSAKPVLPWPILYESEMDHLDSFALQPEFNRERNSLDAVSRHLAQRAKRKLFVISLCAACETVTSFVLYFLRDHSFGSLYAFQSKNACQGD